MNRATPRARIYSWQLILARDVSDCLLAEKYRRLPFGKPPAPAACLPARGKKASAREDSMVSYSSVPRSLLLAGAFFGALTLNAAAQQPATPPAAGAQRPYTDTLYMEPESYYNSSQASATPSSMTTLSRLTLSESDRKRMNLQLRLWKACAEIPMNVVIRVFRDPLECVEAFQVIDPHLARVST